MELDERIANALNHKLEGNPWELLIKLFAADREAFYRLANEGASSAGAEIRELAKLAGKIRSAIRNSYSIETTATGPRLVTQQGEEVPIPSDWLAKVQEFLRSVDGKMTESRCGKDYVGEEISEAERTFKLGDRDTWQTDRQRLERSLDSEPIVLRLSQDEIEGLKTQPPYVVHELKHCAVRTVLAPTSSFSGLKRGPGGVEAVNQGFAFFGKPRCAYDNEGREMAPPDGMLFGVFADSHGFVFDWDWVKEDPRDEGYPLDSELRFESPRTLDRPAALELPSDLTPGHFSSTDATYSSNGDCIFCYMKDDVSWADRINADLTVFRKLEAEAITGFKVKNVRKILKGDESVVLDDAPGLTVAVDAILLATLKLHKDANVMIYTVIIKALLESAPETPKVKVPEGDFQEVRQ